MMNNKMLSERTFVTLALVASVVSLAACGHAKRPRPTAQSRTAQVEQIAKQWRSPGSDKVHSTLADAETPREAIVDRIAATEELLPLGAGRDSVTRLLGRPEHATARRWSYIAARRPVPDGYGGWCVRRFVVTFDQDGHITDETLNPPECPRGVNP